MSWLLAISLLGGSCSRGQGDGNSRAVIPPTATEVFNLRSKCAELGQKIMDGNLVGSALYQSQVSHYDPKGNRCYVRLDVQTADLSSPPDKFISRSYLYDGQTSGLLASFSSTGFGENAKVTGHLFMNPWDDFARRLGMDLQNGRWRDFNGHFETASDLNPGFIVALIDAVMADDR